ncbi:MAG TPA: A24 family peptidase [Bryobacteraceae bacterium]|jgi:prepilin peptidase CpaA
MNAALVLQNLPLMVVVGLAALLDVRFRKIPNALTIPLMLAGLAEAYFGHHGITFSHALLGCLAGFALTFAQFALGALGGGDLKLITAVGAWFGPAGVLGVFMVAAVFGLITVLSQSLMQKQTAALFRNSAVIAINLMHLREVGCEQAQAVGQSCRSIDDPLPYGVSVLVGVVFVMGTPWMSWLIG